MEILDEIKSDIKKDKKIVTMLKKTKLADLSLLHFSLGMYIRNRYLWGKNENIKRLSLHYNVADVDSISSKIIYDIYFEVNKIDNVLIFPRVDLTQFDSE